ncbi:RNA polymerase subunit sigma [Sphingobium sp. Leaf26]|uniref:sigma-70 family RNA polymerase sigma factor n=1 Tax=Sphingobium sp. Leaf26 TaxID=1735693 RepID=UPI0006F4E73B|nr:sigma-70 family RNA polymerase sigma factor [Sphingobium sp. Leaf26]KQN04466.1 RNA polymerase subunit sigma [Sphingobium sp. Leaf26]
MDDVHDMEADLLAMRRYARALARDDVDADDVVQDALLRAIERKATYQPDRSRTRWLLGIVHNVFVSGKRRQAAETRRNDRFAETLLSSVDPQQEDHMRLAEIAHGFATLPDAQRAVLHLTAIEGLGYQQAADILGIPIGTVMSRLSRARAALRDGNTEKGHPHLRLVGGQDDQ